MRHFSTPIVIEKFDADKVYGKMMVYLQDVVAAYTSQLHSQEET